MTVVNENQYSIQRIGRRYAGQIYRLDRVLFPDAPYITWTLSQCKEALYKTKRTANNFMVYDTLKNKMAGYILFDKKENYIDSIAVKPQYRGQRLGTKLMKHLIEENKGKTITLEVLASNEKAIKFYRRFGFEKVKEIKETFRSKKKCYAFTQVTMERKC